MGGEKESFPPLFRQPIYALSTKKERLIPGYDQKWALFILNMPWRYQICIAKCLFPYRGDLPENFGKTTAQEYKTASSDWRASLKIAFG